MILLLTVLSLASPVCLDRAEYDAEVLAPRRDLVECRSLLTIEEGLVVELRAELAARVQAEAEARRQVEALRRRRGWWVAAGVGIGVAASVGVVWTGVQVVGAQ